MVKVRSLSLVKPARGHPQNSDELACSNLICYKAEFARNLDLPEALCSNLQVLDLAGEELEIHLTLIKFIALNCSIISLLSF